MLWGSVLHWPEEAAGLLKVQSPRCVGILCVLLRPIKVCDKAHWTVNTVCPFGGLYPSTWPGPWDTTEPHSPSPISICWRIKGSWAHHSYQSPPRITLLPPLQEKKSVEILPSGYFQIPSFPVSAALGCKITIKHLLQSHEESICPFDVSDHQEARARGVA